MRANGRRNPAALCGLQILFAGGAAGGVSDGQLLERFALRSGGGSEAAFAALVERYGPMVWRTCRGVLRDDHEAGDAFQATFLVLARKGAPLRGRESIGPWLHRVAVRIAVQAKHAAIRRREAEGRAAALGMLWSEGKQPDDLCDLVHEEIDRLPEPQRKVIVLCDLEERSHEDAARYLQCPVGTVKSRQARGRGRLRAALGRRGAAPSAFGMTALRNASPAFERPPQGLVAVTIRGASASIRGVDVVSRSVLTLAEGALSTMVRAKLRSAGLSLLATFGLIAAAWLAHARLAVADPPAKDMPAAATDRDDLEGNWIVRAYPSGHALALVKFERPGRPSQARLVAIGASDFFRLAESTVERFHRDETAVRFTLSLRAARPVDERVFDIVVYRPSGDARVEVLQGSMGMAGRVYMQFPARLERTDRATLDTGDANASSPWTDDFQRAAQAKDPAKQNELFEQVLKKYGDTGVAPTAAWVLPINRANAKAPAAEVRTLIDQAIHVAARYGPEMETGAINVIVQNLTGSVAHEGLVLEYARKAVAKLRPTDTVALQAATLKNLATALKKATTIDEAKAAAEASALEERIARLTRSPLAQPAQAGEIKKDRIPWARNFVQARKQARAQGKLIMVDFYTQSCGWCKRLDSDVFPQPAVAEALRGFVPVKVDAEDGEGQPLVQQYQSHIQGYPAILFLDPASDDPNDGRIVGKIPGFMPAALFVEQLKTIAHLLRDVKTLEEDQKAHPGDMDGLRQLVTALAMQGRTDEAAKLAARAADASTDPRFDRWAQVYSTLGDELMLRAKLGEAAGWYQKAAAVAKRPIDVYAARLGAGFLASLQNRADAAMHELEAAARVPNIPDAERAFANELRARLAEARGDRAPAAVVPVEKAQTPATK